MVQRARRVRAIGPRDGGLRGIASRREVRALVDSMGGSARQSHLERAGALGHAESLFDSVSVFPIKTTTLLGLVLTTRYTSGYPRI